MLPLVLRMVVVLSLCPYIANPAGLLAQDIHPDFEGIDALTQKMQDPDPKVRASAIEGMLFPARAAVEKGETLSTFRLLRKALHDPDYGVRKAAIHILGAMGSTAASAVPDLMMIVRDKKARLRGYAAESLGKIGPAAWRAIPTVVDLLQTKDSFDRERAADALGAIGADADGVVRRALTHALGDRSCEVRSSAATALLRVDPRNPQALRTLRALLHDAKPEARWAALSNLESAGASAQPLVPDLIERLNDKDKGLRQLAAARLWDLGPIAKQAVPALTRMLRDPDDECRSIAAEALESMGTVARSALPELRRLARDAKNESVREFAAQAIRGILRQGAQPSD
jgi:HEAT repeat protein